MKLLIAKASCSSQGNGAAVTGTRYAATVIVLEGGRAVVRRA